jgi:predicted DNA-binding transcriptional regulator YafY
MKKSDRINDMLLYLKDKHYFNLKDLMSRYGISKSTALRDVQSLETLGLPLYSEYGRYGRYQLLENKLLSPIIFSVDELYALYFAMLTLESYQSTPFHLDLRHLKNKFMTCISERRIQKLSKMTQIFSFASQKHPYTSPYLKKILEAAIEEVVCRITYDKNGSFETQSVQFFDISTSFGQWYTSAYLAESKQRRIFRCDKIQSLTVQPDESALTLDKLRLNFADNFKSKATIDFEVTVTSKGVDLFFKEHYPSMNLVNENGKSIIKGYYHPNEENFIASYFLAYGQNILSIKPADLQALVIEKCRHSLAYFETL